MQFEDYFKKKKLKELKDRYGYDMALANIPKPEDTDAMSDNDHDLLMTLMVLDMDRKILDIISDIVEFFDDKHSLKVLVAVLAKSTGQLVNMYAKRYNNTNEIEDLFFEHFERSKKEHSND